ncbi:MAG: cupin domain-containing protein [Acidobacteria bacterium]|nr:cupin domain-containing protein [Acidobacteriota bacterium]MDA1235052.1 cupin domain-containing protein [Acidobacteriota bacterium]
MPKLLPLYLFVSAIAALGAERAVDPTYLYRNIGEAKFAESDETTPTCRYRPLFGAADSEPAIVRGVARFGELTIAPGGKCKVVSYAAEEQIYYVLAGQGAAMYRGTPVAVREGDFMYFAPGSEHTAANDSSATLRIVVMGFKVPADGEYGIPVKLPMAHESEAAKQVVGNHPSSTLYQLLVGDTSSQRDLLAVGHTVTSLFVMEFEPGGTNFSHHHATEEEIYLLLDGEGEIVAGGGADGVEGKHPAKPGDAYFYRLNATMGFYADAARGRKARMLAVRSRYPFN